MTGAATHGSTRGHIAQHADSPLNVVNGSEVRHPSLHQNPEILTMPTTRNAAARIELGQHTDGRWMWGLSWQDGFSGCGFCCGPKWGCFAPTREAALDAAIAQCLEQTAKANTDCKTVRAWAQTLCSRQEDLFGSTP